METTTIRQQEIICASPIQVFEALVNSNLHSDITGSPATGEAKIGEKFTAWDGYIFGKHLKLTPGRKIVQEWTTTDWPENAKPSHLEITLTKDKGGTKLKMVQADVPKEDADSYADGWITYYWKPMIDYFNHHQA